MSGPARYRPIGDYGLIGDTLTVALIARDGALDWLCLPDVDSPALFSALLDADRGGRFALGPVGAARTERAYVRQSAVLRTRHETAEGVLEVTDLMPLALPGDGLRPMRQVVRMVRALEGRPEVAAHLSPRPGYGRRVARLQRTDAQTWTIADGGQCLAVRSDLPLAEVAGRALEGRERLEAGERRTVALAFTGDGPGILPDISPEAVDADLARTLAWWDRLVEGVPYDGPFREQVVRSLVTLRLLTYSQSGAVVAAPTTSLPEAVGGPRNYDYRYCWLRDASFVLDAYAELGHLDVAAAFFRWLMHATQLSAPRLATFYSVVGRTDTGFRQIRTLEGWRGSAPVHEGNAARGQLQLDAYGSVMVAVADYHARGGRLGASERRRVMRMADVVMRSWSLPDNGLWEMPGPRMHHTYSKVMCWAALDAIVRLAGSWSGGADIGRYAAERDRIRENVLRNAWSARRQAFTGAYGRDWLDASLVLMPRFGFIAADDPRMVATFERIEEELGRGAQLRRYRPEVDLIPSGEGTFTACGYWAADYLARAGRLDESERRIGELLGHANDLGLMSEELDPGTGAQLGNFPQSFSHAGLIAAATALHDARRRQGAAA